jgi:hypothetical protein
MSTCPHSNVRCLSEFELIRKYRCESCGAVMMCACDESIGRKFLARQLEFGVELDTKRAVPVTAGFQPKVCEECRGLPLTPHPMAASPGRTSKIARYYWRELRFEAMKRFDVWSQTQGPGNRTPTEDAEIKKKIKRDVLEELKSLHETAPKYTFSKNRPRQIIDKYGVEVVPLKATYGSSPAKRRAIIMDGAGSCSVEEYACRHFRRLGYSAVIVENEPIHVLFGVFMSPVIQDATDPKKRTVGISDHRPFDGEVRGKIIWIRLPDDFGTRGYGVRRAEVIRRHLSAVICEPRELQRLFDLWLGPSADLRQYLSGDRKVQVARQLINILPAAAIIEILRYLIEDYWGRRAGWPDLLVYRDNEFFFAEVKSAGDKLGENQQRWIRDNQQRLHFPFKLVEVLKEADLSGAAGSGGRQRRPGATANRFYAKIHLAQFCAGK